MITLEQYFEQMMKAAWPDVKPNTGQYVDLQNAFYGGALVAFSRMIDFKGVGDVKQLQKELAAHSSLTHARADLFKSIIEAGEEKP